MRMVVNIYQGCWKFKCLAHINVKKELMQHLQLIESDLSLLGLELILSHRSGCSKGDDCPFRHEPAALKNDTVASSVTLSRSS